MTRGELRASVLDALNRKSLSAVADTWITATTTKINVILRHRRMLKHKVLPVTSNVIAAPLDFIEAETARVNKDPIGGPITPGASVGELLYAPPSEIIGMASHVDPSRRSPMYFTTHGMQFELAPWRGDTGGGFQFDLWYYAKIELSKTDDATNFFLEEFPHVYLNGVMAYGHRFLLEHDIALGYEGLFAADIDQINSAEKMAKFGNGPLVVTPARRMGGRFS